MTTDSKTIAIPPATQQILDRMVNSIIRVGHGCGFIIEQGTLFKYDDFACRRQKLVITLARFLPTDSDFSEIAPPVVEQVEARLDGSDPLVADCKVYIP